MNIIKHTCPVYHLTVGPHNPAMRLASGQVFEVTIPDCDGYAPDRKILPRERFAPGADSSQGPIANPVAGPYYVEDAEPGDTLDISVKDICIVQDFGRTGISARQIHIPQHLFSTENDAECNVNVPQTIFWWDIDHKQKRALLKLKKSRATQLSLELSPFIGFMAVAPQFNQFIDCLAVGNYGGNMDIPEVSKGCHLLLPVFRSGGYLFVGDLHAAQGQGEIIGGGVEVGGSVTLGVEVIKNRPITWPQICTQNFIGVIASGATLDASIQIGYAQLVLWLTKEYGYDRWEALNLVSQTGKAHPGNFRSALCSIEKRYL